VTASAGGRVRQRQRERQHQRERERRHRRLSERPGAQHGPQPPLTRVRAKTLSGCARPRRSRCAGRRRVWRSRSRAIDEKRGPRLLRASAPPPPPATAVARRRRPPPAAARRRTPPHARQLLRRHGPAAAAVRNAHSTPAAARAETLSGSARPKRSRRVSMGARARADTLSGSGRPKRSRCADRCRVWRSGSRAIDEKRGPRLLRASAPPPPAAPSAASRTPALPAPRPSSSRRPQRAVDPHGSVQLSSPMRHGPAQLPVSCGAAARRSPEPAFCVICSAPRPPYATTASAS